MGFTLFDEQFLPHAKALIETAKSTIYISTFKAEISHAPRGRRLTDFWDILTQKAKQGIKVFILLNWNKDKKSVAKTNLFAALEMKKHGAQIRHLKNNRCCHTKLILVDDKAALFGSHNLSIKSVMNNFEMSYLTKNPDTVKHIKKTFEFSFFDAQKM
jgi:phosphatidylserine/phosphatidylglycerophosphate/cardiolipin synthase-like enzyme